jgi:iron complex outermembrane receptor protein
VLAQSAIAQEEPAALGEITVTARKREESLQDVPFAISARTGAQLAARAPRTSRTSRGTSRPLGAEPRPRPEPVGIRGISAGKIDRDLAGIKEQVGVYMDESVISLSLFTPDLDLYDLNRVEVLTGPQGTLFGSGSIGGHGALHSNQPDLSDVTAASNAGYDIVDGAAMAARCVPSELPLGDRLLARRPATSTIPGSSTRMDPGQVPPRCKQREKTGGRLALRLGAHADNITITPRVIYQTST